MTRLTDERIAEIEARLANTTPGQRNVHKRKDGSLCVSLGNPEHGPHQQADLYFSEGEADFFTQGKFDVEDLLAVVKALRIEKENMAKEYKRKLTLAIDDYYSARARQQSKIEQLKKQLAQAEAENEELETYASKLICSLTDGKLSKLYEIEVIEDEVQRQNQVYIDGKLADLLAEVKALKAENESMAKEHKRELALAIDDYYCAWGKQQSEMEQLKRQLAQAEAERDVLLHELLKETHSHLCEDPERPCPFDEETEGKCCSNECANADPETCWLKYAQQQAEREGVSK